MTPLVSIIIVSHNQVDYLEAALASVLHQRYQPIEVIGVDDGSTDGTSDLWQRLASQHPQIVFLSGSGHKGYCATFNRGWATAKGKYIIDLSADDVLLPDRIATGVKAMEAAADDYGIHFTDAEYINDQGRRISGHYKRDRKGRLKQGVPSGDLYRELLQRYFICTPTMMIKKEVLIQLDGYDNRLYYEDFDFWVRSSRNYKYLYTDQILVHKRILKNAMGKAQYRPNSPMLEATYLVCEKAYRLNRTDEEHQALARRIRYELRQSILSNNYPVAVKFLDLMSRLPEVPVYYQWFKWLVYLKWNFTFLGRMIRVAK